jgi:TatD DNase family protein
VIDFHCHLDLYPHPVEITDECDKRGIYVLSVTTTPSAWRQTSALADGTRRIRTGLGLHPQLAHERESELPLFDELLPHSPYVGEIGLDGAPEFRRHWGTQLRVFEHILARCSDAGGRILSIHSRRAGQGVLNCLEKFPRAGIPILHWFSGSARDLDRAIKLGCWFSVGPAMLVSEKAQALIDRMPRERVLTESDGPFAQIDGKTLMPWHVETMNFDLARTWSVSPTEVEGLLTANLSTLERYPVRLVRILPL